MDQSHMQRTRHRRDSRHVLRQMDSERRLRRESASAELLGIMRRHGVAQKIASRG